MSHTGTDDYLEAREFAKQTSGTSECVCGHDWFAHQDAALAPHCLDCECREWETVNESTAVQAEINHHSRLILAALKRHLEEQDRYIRAQRRREYTDLLALLKATWREADRLDRLEFS